MHPSRLVMLFWVLVPASSVALRGLLGDAPVPVTVASQAFMAWQLASWFSPRFTAYERQWRRFDVVREASSQPWSLSEEQEK